MVVVFEVVFVVTAVAAFEVFEVVFEVTAVVVFEVVFEVAVFPLAADAEEEEAVVGTVSSAVDFSEWTEADRRLSFASRFSFKTATRF